MQPASTSKPHSAAAHPAGLLGQFQPAAIKGLPKYALLRDTILAAIEAGHWKPGDKLPTEQALARTTPFSLGTVQRALRALVDAGAIARVQGSGTFVSSMHGRIEDVSHCRFLDDDETGFLPVFSQVVSRTRVKEAGAWTKFFPNPKRSVARIDRKLSVNGEFTVYARFFFDAARFSSLAARPLSQLSGANFKELLRDEFSVPINSISQRFAFARFPAGIARAIKADPAASGAIMEVVGRSNSSEVIYYQQIFVPPSPRMLVTLPA